MDNRNYYKSQLQGLQNNFDYQLQVKFRAYNGDGEEGKTTKHLTVNKESLPIIIEFLQSIQNNESLKSN